MAVKKCVISGCLLVAVVMLMLLSACGEITANTGAGSSMTFVDDKLSVMNQEEPASIPDPPPNTAGSGSGSGEIDTPPVVVPGSSSGFIFPYQFAAMDLYGNPIDERTLGEKEVYFVQYWGTWCPPCVGEMPELAELAYMYGDRVGFIGLDDDYKSNID